MCACVCVHASVCVCACATEGPWVWPSELKFRDVAGCLTLKAGI